MSTKKFLLPGSDKYTVDDALSVSSLAVNIFKRKVIATDLSPDLREEDWKIVCEESAITTNTTTTPSLTDCLAIWHFLENGEWKKEGEVVKEQKAVVPVEIVKSPLARIAYIPILSPGTQRRDARDLKLSQILETKSYQPNPSKPSTAKKLTVKKPKPTTTATKSLSQLPPPPPSSSSSSSSSAAAAGVSASADAGASSTASAIRASIPKTTVKKKNGVDGQKVLSTCSVSTVTPKDVKNGSTAIGSGGITTSNPVASAAVDTGPADDVVTKPLVMKSDHDGNPSSSSSSSTAQPDPPVLNVDPDMVLAKSIPPALITGEAGHTS